MSVYVGIDVHRKRSQVAVVAEDGTGAAEQERGEWIRADAAADRRPAAGDAGGVRGRVRLGLAGRAAGGLRLRGAPGAPAAVQGDRLGAAEERQGRRGDPGAAAAGGPAARRRGSPRRQVRQLRALLRHRASLVRLGTQQRNRIHAVAADHGYDRSASYWTGPGRGWLAELDLPAVSREIVTDCLAVIDGLAPVIDRIDGELRQHAKADPRVKVLTTLPGVGQFTALVMLAEIGDISRFRSARKLASWAGLTPTVRGSDLTVRHGHISKQGSAWLRWVLNQAAQTAKRSPEFSATYAAIAKRRGKKIATIAISRKLLTRAWHLLAEMQADRHASAAAAAAVKTGRVTKPRARSLLRHEPAPAPRSII